MGTAGLRLCAERVGEMEDGGVKGTRALWAESMLMLGEEADCAAKAAAMLEMGF
jgi:hypothetical protein